ncbi:MAG TPA: DEAD/DEAH box helicase, partial [Gemmatimonadaceae bacterium]|nr:DEAD/DEAH box helicase [Gemmatimonadaceae bacterium]
RLREARKLCPVVIETVSRHDRYLELHDRFVGMAARVLGPVTIYSIDEIASDLQPDADAASCAALVAEFKAELLRAFGGGLRCSVGVAANVFLAKVAASMDKPDGYVLLDESMEESFVALPLKALPGIGPQTEAKLKRRGVTTIPELFALSPGELRRAWGSVAGENFYHMVRGSRQHDYRQLRPPEERKTVSATQLLAPAARTPEGARAVCQELLATVLRRLRRFEMVARRADFEVAYRHQRDAGQTWTYRASAALPQPADDDLRWLPAARRVLRPPTRTHLQPVNVRVTLKELSKASAAARQDKTSSVMQKVDALNERFGDVVRLGGLKSRRPEDSAPVSAPVGVGPEDAAPVDATVSDESTAAPPGHGVRAKVREMVSDHYGWEDLGDDWTRHLLPLQRQALAAGLCDESRLLYRSGIIAAPTSAGKTLIAEMRMMGRWLDENRGRRKTVVLVPTREIGLEKWKSLTEAYGQRDSVNRADRLTVVYSDGDHHAHDSYIWDGKFDVAVMVNEKFRFFVQNPRFLLEVGEVVFDELSFLADPERGAFLEAALLSVVSHPEPPTVLGLMHPADNISDLLMPLRSPAGEPFLLTSTERPIPIYTGIWSPGRDKALFRHCNTGEEHETDFHLDYPASILSTLRDLIVRYLAPPEGDVRSNLVFAMPTKRQVFDTSLLIASLCETDDEVMELLTVNKSTTLVENRLKGLEPSRVRRLLERIAPLGIGVHSADLSLAERRLVSLAFREGELPVLVCTSTMAYGINLPAQTIVFLNWGQSRGGGADPEADQVPYCQSLEKDFIPWMGRVGRTGQPQPRPPVALYVALQGAGSYEYDTILDLIRRQSVPLAHGLSLSARALPDMLLFAVNTLYHRTKEPVVTAQVLDFFRRAPGGDWATLLATVEGMLEAWSVPGSEDSAEDPGPGGDEAGAAGDGAKPADALTEVNMAPLNSTIVEAGGETTAGYTVTLLGRIASANGVQPETCRRLRLVLAGRDRAPWDMLDVLALLLSTPDGQALQPIMIQKDYHPLIERLFGEVLGAKAEQVNADLSPLLQHLPASVHVRGTLLALRSWCEGEDLFTIETTLGLVKADANLYEKARGFARLVRLFATLAQTQPGREKARPASEPPATTRRLLPEHDLEMLADELLFGTPADATDLARLGIENLARAWVMRLREVVESSPAAPDLPFLERLRLIAEEDEQKIFDALPTYGLAARVVEELKETARRPLGDLLRADPELVANFYAHPLVARAQVLQGAGRFTALKVMHRRTYSVFRRNEKKGVPIRLKDEGDVGYWVDRGAVEFLGEVGVMGAHAYAVDRLLIDFDAHNGFDFDGLKEVTGEVYRRLRRHPWVDPERMYVNWTGGRGFHVVGQFRGERSRTVEQVKAELDSIVAGFCDDVSVFSKPLTAIYEPHVVLDVSPVMRRGVYRNAFSFHSAAGGVSVPVEWARLKEFDPERRATAEWVSGVFGRMGGEPATYEELVSDYWRAERELLEG